MHVQVPVSHYVHSLPYQPTSPLRIATPFTAQILKERLVMTRHNDTTRSALQLLETLGAAEPRGVVAGEPALWDTVTPL